MDFKDLRHKVIFVIETEEEYWWLADVLSKHEGPEHTVARYYDSRIKHVAFGSMYWCWLSEAVKLHPSEQFVPVSKLMKGGN